MELTEIENIWERCLQNDRRAQEEIYNLFSSKMFGMCKRYAQSNAEAEDILQNGFIKVFTKARLYDGKGSLEGWIRRVMVNTAIESYRQRKISFVEMTDPEATQLKSMLDADNTGYTDLLRLVASLPLGYRTVFNLYVVEGFSHKEIAAMLGISESSSKSQLSRARNWLKDKLAKTTV